MFTIDYQQDSTWQPKYAPYDLTLTDADVKDDPPDVSLADHPIWNTPNEITPDDFANWGGEEFASDGPEEVKDTDWTILLEAGPQMWPIVLLAEYGRGAYIFSALELSQVALEEKVGKEGALRIAQNFIEYYRIMDTSVSFQGKIAFTWGRIKGDYR